MRISPRLFVKRSHREGWFPVGRTWCFLFLFTVVGLQWASELRAQADRPNIVVVFCDNLGYGDIEPFGSTVHRTPNLNRMAAEGRRFTHFCVSAGVCTPSRASLLTGCYAQRIGMHLNPRDGQVLRPVSPYGLNPQETTIAEVLKRAGYATAIIGKWHLGDQPEFLPTRHGFDWFYGIPYSDDMTREVGQRLGARLDGNQWPPLPLMENDKVIEAPVDRNLLTKRYTEKALDWIESNRDRPFFLYLPQAMPGSTRNPFSSEAFRGKSRNGAWGDAVEELDWSIGRILKRLEELKLGRKTLVVWTSDNGAPLSGKKGDLSRGSNSPLHGRGYTTSEGAFRVPTIFWQPGTVPEGTVCRELATTMDLLPTFAAMAGSPFSEKQKIDGRDISSLIYGHFNARSPHRYFCYYYQDQLQAIRSGPWKLFLNVRPIGPHPHFDKKSPPETLLFHLYRDPGCRKNVAAENPKVVRQLLAYAEKAREELGDRNAAGQSVRGNGQRPAGHVSGTPTPRRLSN